MFTLRWFDDLRFAHKLAALLVFSFLVFIGLAAWNGYANRVVDGINLQAEHASRMRGDAMASALIALHYGAAVENQIPDTIRLKRGELMKALGALSEVRGWVAKQDNADLQNGHSELLQQGERVLGLAAKAGEGVPDEAALLGDMATAFNQTLQAHIDSLSQHRAQQRNDLEFLNVMVLGVAILVSIAVGLWIARSINLPLNQAVKVASAVAQGDLTQGIEVKSGGETGQLLHALKDMNERLVGIVTGVRRSTDGITLAAEQVAAGNADLSQRTEEQASSLEETASSMEELISTVRQNADNARQANQLAANASEIAVKGGQAVGDVVHTMSSISESSKKIVDIISVIESIAFQTNILALNAAVEAARAGEQGRGFAVVAGEVRNLAQRSAAAAKEIKTLIDDSANKVDAGSKQVDQAGATMTEIVQAVKRVTDIIAEIAAASNEQSAGIEQVNQAIAQMDGVTQQNAALVEEAAAAAEAMREQAKALYEAVAVFRIAGGREAPGLEAVASAEKTVVQNAAVVPIAKARRLAKAKNEGGWKEF